MEVEVGLAARRRLGPSRLDTPFVGLDLGQLLDSPPISSQPSSCRLDRHPDLVQFAEVAELVAAFEIGVQPADDVRIEEMPCPPWPDTRPGLRSDLDQSLGLQHLDRLAHHGAADAQPRCEIVLVGQRRSSAPLTTHDPPPELVDDPAVQPAPWISELIHTPAAPRPRLAPR